MYYTELIPVMWPGDFELGTYEVSSGAHHNRAFENLQAFHGSRDPRFLFYAALELRNCIERFLFEYLVLIHVRPEKLEKFRNEYRIKNLERAIREAEPEWETKIAFANFYMEVVGLGADVRTPDVNRLNQLYGQLGNYLHSLKNPDDTTEDQRWWQEFIDLVETTKNYTYELLSGGQAIMHLTDAGLELYRGFRDKTIPVEELADRIRREARRTGEIIGG